MGDHPHHHAVFWVDATARVLAALRQRRPQVHALTSPVAQALTANLLLAAGAKPSLSQAPGEIEAFAENTDALLINLGMFDASRAEAARRALPILERRRVPWVLDPVKVERSTGRFAFAEELVARGPQVLRGNAAEIPLFETIVDRQATVIAKTGAEDRIEAGKRWILVENGHPLMAAVTAVGCAGGALVAAFLAVEPDAFIATGAALLAIAVAGEIAGEHVDGPGSFQPALIDALYALDAAALEARARVS
ncbi:MAG: hydroxyethylthiazole kinase [Pseudomonadota bacterium]